MWLCSTLMWPLGLAAATPTSPVSSQWSKYFLGVYKYFPSAARHAGPPAAARAEPRDGAGPRPRPAQLRGEAGGGEGAARRGRWIF